MFFENVYFIIRTSYAGKSTMVKKLVEKYNGIACEENYQRKHFDLSKTAVLRRYIWMTVILKRTEERWLTDLYGDEYKEYCKRVNRCIPWLPR